MGANQKTANLQAARPRRSLRALLVEDSETDGLLLKRALDRGWFATTCERVDTAEKMQKALASQPWDLILCDHSMPQFSAPEALDLLKKHRLDIPFIIVSGYIEEETAIAAMHAGAHDYIMKDRLARLVPAVERELREAEVRRARQKSEEDLRRAHEELELRVEQRTADLRRANKQLHEMFEERKRLEHELLEIAENERRRIGFDLHDDLGQKLTGVSLMLKGLEQRLATDKHACFAEAQKIEQLLDEVMRHTHDLAKQFSSLDIQGDDLGAVLKGLAGNVKKMFGITCGFTLKGTLPELPRNTIAQLYKIAQEAISNAIKHGKATEVTIGLLRQDDQLVLTIRNDGIPFVQPSSKHRMGLRIMNYRANTVGATLDVKAADGSGTLVTCEIPVKNGSKTSLRSAEDGNASSSPAVPTSRTRTSAAPVEAKHN